MMRARMLRASARVSASSFWLGDGRAGGDGSRKARVSCIATLLIGRRLSVRNQAAAQESVDDHPGVEQIGKCGETGGTLFATRCRQFIISSHCFPIGPTRRNERAAAVGK